MLHYTDADRGTFQNLEYARQLVSFDGMRYEGRCGLENVTPTDIDGYIQLDLHNIFIIFELKHIGIPSDGQKNALVKMVDALRHDKKNNAVLFIAEHNTDGMIIAKDAIVTKAYWRGRWFDGVNGLTLDASIRKYIQFIRDKNKCEGDTEGKS